MLAMWRRLHVCATTKEGLLMQTTLFDPDELEQEAETKSEDPAVPEAALDSMQSLLKKKRELREMYKKDPEYQRNRRQKI